jgi:hypothetical protein
MAKLAKRGNAQTKVVIAKSNPEAIQMFGGLTLAQVGEKFDLDEADAEWYEGTNPKTNEIILSLLLTVKGTIYQIPLSKGFTEEMQTNWDALPNCMFYDSLRASTTKDANGVVSTRKDEQGNVIMEHYMCLGKPAGIVLVDENRYGVFENAPELEPETTIADTTTTAKPKARAGARR